MPLIKDSEREGDLLARVQTCAAKAIPSQSKLRALDCLLRRLERLGEHAIVFTEYRDTLLHVRDALRPDAGVIHGGIGREELARTLSAFTKGTSTLLFATDAAGEGLNLHQFCRVIINLELPWNPLRLEQRIGRVDRIGQQRRVHVFHLIASGTAETRVRERLRERLRRAKAAIAVSNPLDRLDDNSDEDIARNVIAESQNDSGQQPRAETAGAALLFPRLPDEALDERRRVQLIRALARGDGPAGRHRSSTAPHALVAFSRRRALRARFPRRTIAMLPRPLEDGVGRIAATRTTSIVFPTPRSVSRRERGAVLELTQTLMSIRLDAIDAASKRWSEQAAHQHDVFWGARLTRERAIAETLSSSQSRPMQSGLFDRRADRRRAREAAIRNEFIDAISRRSAGAEQARAALCHAAAPLILVIE